MLESFHQLPEGAIERRRHAHFFAPLGDGAIHEINFSLALGKNVLQHAGFVFARSVRAFLHERAGITVKFNAEGFGDGFSFRNERVKERSGRSESRSGAVMQQGKRANRIRRGVEDEFCPLRAARVAQRDDAQACAIEKLGELLDASVRCVRRFERTDPRVAINVKPDVARLDDVAGGKRGAADDVADVFGKDFFVADAVLDRADGALFIEYAGGLLDGAAGMRAFGGHNAEVANRNFTCVRSGVETRSEIRGATNAQAAIVDGASMFFPNVIGVDFDVFEAGAMRAEKAANLATTDDAKHHAHAGVSASTPG